MNAIKNKQAENYELIKGLNNLMNCCEDARLGYKRAMKLVDNVKIKHLLESKALARARFRNQITNDILILGGNPSQANTSIMADTHQAWMGLRVSITKNNTETILSECIRGEKELLDAFDYCLENKPMNNDIYYALTVNKQALEKTIYQLEELVAKEELVS